MAADGGKGFHGLLRGDVLRRFHPVGEGFFPILRRFVQRVVQRGKAELNGRHDPFEDGIFGHFGELEIERPIFFDEDILVEFRPLKGLVQLPGLMDQPLLFFPASPGDGQQRDGVVDGFPELDEIFRGDLTLGQEQGKGFAGKGYLHLAHEGAALGAFADLDDSLLFQRAQGFPNHAPPGLKMALKLSLAGQAFPGADFTGQNRRFDLKGDIFACAAHPGRREQGAVFHGSGSSHADRMTRLLGRESEIVRPFGPNGRIVQGGFES